MRNIISLILVAIVAALGLTGCNSAEQKNGGSAARTAGPPASSAVYADGVRRVTPTELQAMLSRDEAFVVDVRNQDAYNTAHVRGAKLIPDTDVAKRSDELPRDKLIVTYCS